MTYGETWRMVKPPLALIAVAMRALGIPVNIRCAYPAPAWFSVIRVEYDALSADCLREIDTVEPQWKHEGFHSPVYCKLVALGQDTSDSGGVFLLHPGGRMAAATLFARARTGQKAIRSGVGTFLKNSHSIGVSNHGGYFDAPAGSENRCLVGATISQLVQAHTARLATVPDHEVFPVQNCSDFELAFDRREALQTDSLIDRGIYREVSPSEIEALSVRCKLQP